MESWAKCHLRCTVRLEISTEDNCNSLENIMIIFSFSALIVGYQFIVACSNYKKAQLWLRNPRDATAFQIHPEETHRNYKDDDDDDFSFTSRRNENSVRLLWLHTA